MKPRLLLFAALLAPGVALAQVAPAAQYARYAAAIATKADSAVGYLTSQVGSLSDEAAVERLATGATRMKRLTAEFAASTPPEDLATAHHDLVAALTDVTNKADRAATLMRTAMNTSNSDEARATAAESAQRELMDLRTAIGTYDEARSRAARTLELRGASLPLRP